MEEKQEVRARLNREREIQEDTEEENKRQKNGRKEEKEWRKGDKIIYVRKCKVWSNQYKEAKKELEERRVQHKNKKIELITKEIRQNIKKGNTRKVWQRLNEMKQGGEMKGGGLSLKNEKGKVKQSMKSY